MTEKKLAEIDFEQLNLSEFTERSYLDYSMYVILDRALPNIGDGLKPVQRRIIYAMSELGLRSTAKYKKSARTVGDVLGKFHPHGDSACYEAMVLMAQSFSYRYPLIDGQGNFGSIDDPKSFAAMRYTESRLSKFAQLLLQEVQLGTVDWQPNFDGSIDEPVVLPAEVPHVILNGTMGIAVGMSTDIPPHNIGEVIGALIHLLDNPKAGLEDVMKHLPGPDYPTEAELTTSAADLKSIYSTGHGSVKLRSTYRSEGAEIIIESLPYQASGAKILEKIAQQMQNKKLPMVVDLRDESDHENPIRLVIQMRSNRVDADALMSHLFLTTDLEKSYRVNLNMIGLDGRPQVKPLVPLLNEWLTFREQTVVRRLQSRLDKVLARLHILQGFQICYLNIDEVIAIIRESEKPKQELMERFKLTDIQADAVLDLKLRHLAKLEEFKLKAEQDELEAEQADLDALLSSPKRRKTLMKKELRAILKVFDEPRRSPIVERSDAVALSEIVKAPSDPMMVVLSEKGWVRAAKGHDLDPANLNYKSGDGLLESVLGRSDWPAIFLDNTGRTYNLPTDSLPSARGQGEPLTGRLKPPAGSMFVGVLSGEPKDFVMLASSSGYGFRAVIEDLLSRGKSGKQILNVGKAGVAISPALVQPDDKFVACATAKGFILVFDIKELSQMSKGKGVKLIKLSKGDSVVSVATGGAKASLNWGAGSSDYQMSPKQWRAHLGERATAGIKPAKGHKIKYIWFEE